LLIVPVLVYLAGRFSFVEQGLSNIAHRFTVFLYITIPVGVISTFITLIRVFLGNVE